MSLHPTFPVKNIASKWVNITHKQYYRILKRPFLQSSGEKKKEKKRERGKIKKGRFCLPRNDFKYILGAYVYITC